MRTFAPLLWAALVFSPSCDETARVIGLAVLAFVIGVGIIIMVFAALAARMAIKYRSTGWIATAVVYGLLCVAGAVSFVFNDDVEPVPMTFLGVAGSIALIGAGIGLRRRPEVES